MVCCGFDLHINVQQIISYQTSLVPYRKNMSCYICYIIFIAWISRQNMQNMADKNGAKVAA